MHHTTHRTRPVKNKQHSMVLTFRDDGNFLEKIFVELVGVKFAGVQNTSA